MPLTTETMRKEYNGNGSTTVFAYDFLIYDEDHLIIYVDDVLQVIVTDYSVSDVGDVSGGDVTFVVAPPTGTGNVIIIRDLPFTQEADYVAYSPFRAETHERVLNKLVMMVLRNKERLDRALMFEEYSLAGPGLTLPDPDALKGLRWNAGETGLENYTIT